MTATVEYGLQGSIALLALANPPVNALSQAVCRGIKDGLARALADDAVRAIVVIGRGRGFCAGADISEFGKPRPPDAVHLRHLIIAFDASPKPLIAAIHGNALGGGLELALGCHWRIAAPDARLGLPEVKIGLLPGAGGTVRLPRLIGAEAALGVMVTGEPIDGRAAARLGLIDELADGDLEAQAVGFAERVLAERRALRRTRDQVAPPVPPDFFAAYRAKLKKSARGLEAPLLNVDCVEAGLALSIEQEAATFDRQLKSAQSKSADPQLLRRAQGGVDRRRAARHADDQDRSRRGDRRGGTMGGGIAMCFANAGIPVVLMGQPPPTRSSAGSRPSGGNYCPHGRARPAERRRDGSAPRAHHAGDRL